jgi:tight adherence protein C
VTATVVESASPMGHPSLAWREMVNKLGSLVPSAPKDSTVMLRRLMRAGLRGPNALKMLYGSKAILAVLLPAVAIILTANSDVDPGKKILLVTASLAAGFFAPNEYVRLRAKRRQKNIRKGLPNALDLMVVCVESGLGLDQAIVQVAKELLFAHPEISQEFGLMNLEMKAGSRRADALRNLADRTGVEEAKKLVAVLIQADRFGTSIAQSLRGHSEFMRVQTRQMAEEKAAKLGVKLVFPIFFCILPSLFVVTVGPVLVRIVRDLIPMMINM